MLIWSDEKSLQRDMLYFVGRGFAPPSFTIKKITNGLEFLESLQDSNVRAMVDPKIINAHHTKWTEPIKHEDKWKFFDQERN